MSKILAPVWNYLLSKGYSINTSMSPGELITSHFKNKIEIHSEDLDISLTEVNDDYYNALMGQLKNKGNKKEPKINKINGTQSRVIALTFIGANNKVTLIDGDEYINWLVSRKTEKDPKTGVVKNIKEKIYTIELSKKIR